MLLRFLLALPFFWAAELRAQQLFEFRRLVAHWDQYATPEYLDFLERVRPEIAQVGFYGGHFWSLAATEHGGGYPAHFPVRGYREGAAWFTELNRKIRALDIRAVGHLNLTFLVGDPDSPEGPRGFFEFWRDGWDETLLGKKPVVAAEDLLERNPDGSLRSTKAYGIGGMREYHACLRNPHWRQVLKAFVSYAIDHGVDGLIANYFYRHDCLCEHCVEGFRSHLQASYSKARLKEMGIEDVRRHVFTSIPSWHDPKSTNPYRLAALRYSQYSNQEAFREVFIEHGRARKLGFIVAQWNHLGDFAQIAGDELCLVPRGQWRGMDYVWYSTGGAANFTKLEEGFLGEATLQARYLQGIVPGRYTLGKYESVRTRAAISELAANGGAPMGFYARTDSEARAVFERYYGFLRRHEVLYRDAFPHSECTLLFPRRAVFRGELAPLERFREIGNRLLDEHVLFRVLPDEPAPLSSSDESHVVVDPNDEAAAGKELTRLLASRRTGCDASRTVRLSASSTRRLQEITLHFVNYDREEREKDGQRGGQPGGSIRDEKPRATKPFELRVRLPSRGRIEAVELLTPEVDEARVLEFQVEDGMLRTTVPSFLVYGVVYVHWNEAMRGVPPVPESRAAYERRNKKTAR